MDKIRQKLKDLTMESGVYIMKSATGQILYIGKALHLKNRVGQYFMAGTKTTKVALMVSKIDDFDYIITRNEVEALVLENNLIKQHKPPYNILLKDDKSYPFIKIDIKKPFPTIEIVRKLRSDGAKYFGPYMVGVSAREITDLIYSAFPLRSCKFDLERLPKSHRPCLNYHIQRCGAPCAGKITREEYAEVVDKVTAFLGGNDKSVAAVLKKKMNDAAEEEDFELAMYYREKLAVLDKLVRRQVTALPKAFNLDIFAIASNGLNTVVTALFVRGGKLLGSDKRVINDNAPDEETALSNFLVQFYDNVNFIPDEVVTDIEVDGAQALEEYLSDKKGSKINVVHPKQGVRRQMADMARGNAQDYLEKSLSVRERHDNMTLGAMLQLQEALKLDRIPARIECYDISHVQGSDKVASMVVFVGGEAYKAHYRKFRITTVEGNDDFASLHETLKRRLARLGGDEKDESFAAVPDLIVIDGGKGQLSSVMASVAELEVPALRKLNVVSLAKREEEVFTPSSPEPIILPRDSYGLKLLQRIRDEAHRFAITFHRQLRGKRQTSSTLSKIRGVGDTRQKALMAHFGNISNIRDADEEELASVKGIDAATARNIVEFFAKARSTSEEKTRPQQRKKPN